MFYQDGWTALRYGASRGYIDIVRMLVDAGAELNIKCKVHFTNITLSSLVCFGLYPLLFYQDGETALMGSVCKGHKDIVRMLIDAGADLNVQSTELVNIIIDLSRLSCFGLYLLLLYQAGWTALIYSVYKRYKDIVRMLVDAGADLNVQDKVNSIIRFIKISLLWFISIITSQVWRHSIDKECIQWTRGHCSDAY